MFTVKTPQTSSLGIIFFLYVDNETCLKINIEFNCGDWAASTMAHLGCLVEWPKDLL